MGFKYFTLSGCTIKKSCAVTVRDSVLGNLFVLTGTYGEVSNSRSMWHLKDCPQNGSKNGLDRLFNPPLVLLAVQAKNGLFLTIFSGLADINLSIYLLSFFVNNTIYYRGYYRCLIERLTQLLLKQIVWCAHIVSRVHVQPAHDATERLAFN